MFSLSFRISGVWYRTGHVSEQKPCYSSLCKHISEAHPFRQKRTTQIQNKIHNQIDKRNQEYRISNTENRIQNTEFRLPNTEFIPKNTRIRTQYGVCSKYKSEQVTPMRRSYRNKKTISHQIYINSFSFLTHDTTRLQLLITLRMTKNSHI